jgi:RimJ/RimL family protein N-acetyltransferase
VISIEQRQEFFDFVNRGLDVAFDPAREYCICIASLSDAGEILGVVVFSGFTSHNVELSVYSITPKFLTRDLLKVIFHYAFITAGKRRVTAIVEEGNDKALDIDQRIGFVHESVAKNWYGDKDGIVLRMLREECKWV